MSLRENQIFFTNRATFNEMAKPTSTFQGLSFGNWRIFSEPKKVGVAGSSPRTDWAAKCHDNVYNNNNREKKFTKVVFTSIKTTNASSPTTAARGSPSGQSPKSTNSATAAAKETQPSSATSQMSLGEHQILQQLEREPSRLQQPQPHQPKNTHVHRKANPYRVRNTEFRSSQCIYIDKPPRRNIADIPIIFLFPGRGRGHHKKDPDLLQMR